MLLYIFFLSERQKFKCHPVVIGSGSKLNFFKKILIYLILIAAKNDMWFHNFWQYCARQSTVKIDCLGVTKVIQHYSSRSYPIATTSVLASFQNVGRRIDRSRFMLYILAKVISIKLLKEHK